MVSRGSGTVYTKKAWKMQGRFGSQKLKDTNTVLRRGAVVCWKHKVLSNSPRWHLFLLPYPLDSSWVLCFLWQMWADARWGSLVWNLQKKLHLVFSIVRITLKPRRGVFADLLVLFFQTCWKYFAWHILRFLDFLFMIRICGQLPVAQKSSGSFSL